MAESPLLALQRSTTLTTNESSSVNETAEGKFLKLVRRKIGQVSLINGPQIARRFLRLVTNEESSVHDEDNGLSEVGIAEPCLKGT
jgi:hypothetical protein